MVVVGDMHGKIDELAGLIDEFKLAEGSLKGEDWHVTFKKRSTRPAPRQESHVEEYHEGHHEAIAPVPVVVERQKGTPVSSPMNGIYYGAPSPASPPFVKEGESVIAGQVVGLIEAMKVFNEIVSPLNGTVLKVLAETGQLVQPGEPLLYIG